MSKYLKYILFSQSVNLVLFMYKNDISKDLLFSIYFLFILIPGIILLIDIIENIYRFMKCRYIIWDENKNE